MTVRIRIFGSGGLQLVRGVWIYPLIPNSPSDDDAQSCRPALSIGAESGSMTEDPVDVSSGSESDVGVAP